MKIALSLAVVFVALVPASSHAQMFRPGGAARGGQGGNVTSAPTRSHGSGYAYRHGAPGWTVAGVGHGHRRFDHGYVSRGYGFGYGTYSYSPTRAYSYYPGYSDAYPYPYYETVYSGARATNGLILGALAGGIIGNNSGEFRHNGWRGAAWGAGLGWLLGSVAEANHRAVSHGRAPVVVPTTPTVQYTQSAAAAPAPQPVTIINNYYGNASPMSGANSLFGR